MAVVGRRGGKVKIQPLEDRVVVERLAAPNLTAGGIVLPDAAQEKPQRGIVVAVGPGRLLKSGQRGELSISVGEEVVFSTYGGIEINVSGDDYTILREDDILAAIPGILASLPGNPMTPGPRPRTTTGNPMTQGPPPRPKPGSGPTTPGPGSGPTPPSVT